MGRSGITGEISVKLTLHDIDQDRAVALVRGIAGVVHENGGALNTEGAAGLPTPMRRALGVLPPNRALPPPLGPHRGRARAEVLAWFEKAYLESLLASADGRLVEAARRARMDRKSLWRMIKRHGAGRGRVAT